MHIVSLLREFVQHLIVISCSGVPQGWISVLVEGTSTVDWGVVPQEFPNNLQLNRVYFGDVLGCWLGTASSQAFKDQLPTPNQPFIRIKVKVWQKQADRDAVIA
jgi:hypothetical protein